jgi:drug/metabolite transporter (DMT)-like permease
MGVLYGLAAALCWGLGDFLITILTRRIGTPRAIFATQILSLASWLILLLLMPSSPDSGINVWALAIIAGVCHVTALLLTYRAFEIGTLALVSPIISGFAVVTALLALMSGERPPVPALAGTFLLIVGVVLATRAPSTGGGSIAGVPQAIGSALAFGVMFWMFDFIQPTLGFIWPLIVLKVMASTVGLWGLRTARAEVDPLHDAATSGISAAPTQTVSNWMLAAGVAMADSLAWVVFIFGTRTEYTTVVTALASLFSAVTILLAWAFLKERLASNQWAGIAIVLLGILLVSL